MSENFPPMHAVTGLDLTDKQKGHALNEKERQIIRKRKQGDLLSQRDLNG